MINTWIQPIQNWRPEVPWKFLLGLSSDAQQPKPVVQLY
jgi:hypothetical protein